MTAHHWILTAHGTDQTLTDVLQLLLGKASPRIETIAHSLAQINRFTGHCSRPYSVAEHSVLVCDIVAGMGLGLDAQLLALLHDAHECVVGDVATPLKHTLGVAWPCVENLHAFGLRVAYDLVDAHAAHASAVKTADLMALAIERRDLLPFYADHNRPWPALDTPGAQVVPLPHIDLTSPLRAAMTWHHHRVAFLRRFEALSESRQFLRNAGTCAGACMAPASACIHPTTPPKATA